MANFVLIHGAWHGPWCWYKVENILKSLNHHNINIIDLSNASEQTTDAYASYVDNLLSTLEDQQIVVGHSMAGLILSKLNSLKIKKLVYLSAFLLNDGEKIIDIIKKYPIPYLKLEFDKKFIWCSVTDENKADLFYNKCSDQDIKFAKANLKPQIYSIFNQAINPNIAQNFKKYYIRCIDDNIISIKAQDHMIDKQNLNGVYSLKSDHSPFFSDVENFCNILIDISND